MPGIRSCAPIIVCLSVVAVACESLPAGSKVPDESSAIAWAKRRCHYEKPFMPYEKWHAALHQGIWHVWLSLEPGAQDEPAPGSEPDYDFLDIRIRAGDGVDSDCVMEVG